MHDAFSAVHPLVTFFYFLLVIGLSMFLMHPACLGISLLCALLYAICLQGRRSVRLALYAMLPIFLFSAVLNPLFNHEGSTILTYFPGGNPLTLESMFYGVAAAAMTVAVLLWFVCLNRVLTSDKIQYLFGRVLPALSLIFSMTLRFVPRFAAQMKKIAAAQRGIGRDVTQGDLRQRLRSAASILSALLSWSLEQAVVTADSMKNRGYGLPGRTAYAPFVFTRRDLWILLYLLLMAACVIMGQGMDLIYWQYYPVTDGQIWDPAALFVLTAYLALCAMPVILHVWEDRKWHSLRSEI